MTDELRRANARLARIAARWDLLSVRIAFVGEANAKINRCISLLKARDEHTAEERLDELLVFLGKRKASE
jgi:hypothetical protein